MPDRKPFEIIPGDMSRGLLIICDHARNALPASMGTLGLPEKELQRHIAYDIGAEALFTGIVERLGVPGIMSTWSRLLIDPNRGEDDPTLIRQIYDRTVIPGNYPMSAQEREWRLNTFYRPYHEAVEAKLMDFEATGITPAIFSIHTMTDTWHGWRRPWHASILWDRDPRFAIPMLEELRRSGEHTIGDNEPYDGALAQDTLSRHGTANGFAHALLEIRQDLVQSQEDIAHWVGHVAPMVEKINALEHIHERKQHGTRTRHGLIPAVSE